MQISFFLAIDLLRRFEFDIHVSRYKLKKIYSLNHSIKYMCSIQSLKAARGNILNDNKPADVSLWTNENFCEWLKLVNLQVISKFGNFFWCQNFIKNFYN